MGQERRNDLARGGDLGGTGGTVPQKIWDGGTVHASVPPIFWEVVLSDARESIYEQSF